MSFFIKKSAKSIGITPVTAEGFDGWLAEQDSATKAMATAAQYRAAAGSFLIVPHDDGSIKRVLFGIGRDDSIYAYAALPALLPPQKNGYYIAADMTAARLNDIALGWALGSYSFNRYKSGKARTFAQLALSDMAAVISADVIAEAVHLVRDLVNTPANDMGPAEIAEAAARMIAPFTDATIKTITGKDLEKKNYPAIYAVGKGSPREPRLIDIRWGADKKLPLVTLVGKGVAFDTGGLDIKPGSAMILMKKDMGGAAHAIALAQVIMTLKLPLRLRVLIPAVENSIDGHSFRPSDVLQSRKGITIEVGNTDAEGRLILCDALHEACSDKPDLLIDFATLTGAARVALGPELPAMFSNDDATAEALLAASRRAEDPLWRLPLWQNYADMLSSRTADTNNIGGSFAGCILAALFLEKFVSPDTKWVHIDTYAWNAGSRPGRPDGGEALGLRAVLNMLQTTYGKKQS